MRSDTFKTQTCSVARALELVGEWWTLLIFREAFFGTRRFSDFERNLGIAKNVLSERLTKLVGAGLMERFPVAGRGNPQDYVLTEKGEDLLPVVVALMQWGDRWIYGGKRAPIRLLERETRDEIERIEVRTPRGKRLPFREIVVVSGPGATDAVRRRFGPGTQR